MKKYLSVLLSLMMCFTTAIMPVNAEGEETPVPSEGPVQETVEQPESTEEPEPTPVSEEQDEGYPEATEQRYIDIHFDKNSETATGDMESQTVLQGEEASLLANEYINEGYRFVSWNTESDGSGIIYYDGQNVIFDDETASEIILYAQWEAIETAAEKEDEETEIITFSDEEFVYEENPDGTLLVKEYTGSSDTVTIPSSVNGKSVTKIGSYLFSNNNSITKVIISDGITWINSSAFNNCGSLEKIVIPGTVTRMSSRVYPGIENCPLLKTAGPTGGNYNIEFGWTEIPDKAFWGCDNLEKAVIPSTVTKMGSEVFLDCALLRTAGPIGGDYNIEFGWTDNIPNGAFSGNNCLEKVVIPESVRKMNQWTFTDCPLLKTAGRIGGDYNIEFGSCIPEYAFFGSNYLESVIIQNTVTEVGWSAFANCEQLRTAGPLESGSDISFDWSEKIPDNAFRGSNYLKKITIPGNITQVGFNAFSDCRYLKTAGPIGSNSDIEFGWTDNIPDNAFSGSGYKDTIETIIIPEGITTIGYGAFGNNTSLKKVIIPGTVTKMGAGVFEDCPLLKTAGPAGGDYNIEFGWTEKIPFASFWGSNTLESVTIPKGMISLEGSVFRECSALRTITIPNSVMEFGGSVFGFGGESECVNLEEIIFLGSEEEWDQLFNKLTKYDRNYLSERISSGKTIITFLSDVPTTEIGTVDEGIKFDNQTIKLGDTVNVSVDIFLIHGDAKAAAESAMVWADDSDVLTAARKGAVTEDNQTASFTLELKGKKIGSTNLNFECDNGIKKTVLITVEDTDDLVNADEETIKASLEGSVDINNMMPSSMTMNMGEINGPEVEFNKKKFPLFELPFSNFSLNLANLNYSVKFDAEKKTVKYIVGLSKKYATSINDSAGYVKKDKEKDFEKNWGDFKSYYYATTTAKENAKNNALLFREYSRLDKFLEKRDMSMGISCSGTVSGFFELSYASGNWECIEAGFNFTVSAAKDITAYIAPPCYVAFGADGKASLSFEVEADYDSNRVKHGLEGSVSFGAKIGVGAGDKKITKTYLEAGLNGSIAIPINYSEEKTDTVKTTALTVGFWLKGKVYLKASALWIFSTSVENDLGDGLCLFSHEQKETIENVNKKTANVFNANGKTQSIRSVNDAKPIMSFSQSNFTAVPRFAANNTPIHTAGNDLDEYEISGAADFSNPQTAVLNNGSRLLVWMEDVPSKADDDRLTIYYSVYDAGTNTWSEKAALFENNAYNGVPAIASNGEKIGIVWQRASRTLGTSGELEQLTGCLDLWFTEFDGISFTEPVCISDFGNGLAKDDYSITYVGDKAIITWTENTENDLFNMSGNNILYKREVEGTLRPIEEILTSDKSISDITVTGEDGSKISYRETGDDESVVSVYTDGEDSTALAEGNIAHSQWFGGKLYYIKDNALLIEDNGQSIETGITGINEFTVLGNDNQTVILTNISDGYRSEIYKSVYDDSANSWSIPVQITDFGGKIRSYSAILADDGTVQLTCNVVAVNDSEENPFGEIEIKVLNEKELPDLMVEEFGSYDSGNVAAGKELPVTVTATNNSLREIQNFSYTVYDSEDAVLATGTVSQTLNAGETADLQINVKLPEELTKTSLKLEIIPDFDDYNHSNNSAVIEVGHADLSVSNLNAKFTKGVAQLSGTITNNGFETASPVNIAIRDLASGEIIYETSALCDQLEPGASTKFVYNLPDKYWTLLNDATKHQLEVNVTCDNLEARFDNNKEIITFGDLHQVDIIKLESIAFKNTDVTLFVDETKKLVINYIPSAATIKKVTITSSDPEVATADNDGVVKGLKPGTAVLTAVSRDGNLTAQCTIHVVSDKLRVDSLETNYPYTGSALKPEVKVYDGDRLLKAGTDYTITYKNNTKAAAADSAKAPTITIKGKGSYTATKTLHFNIDPADINEVSVAEVTLAQTAKPKKLTVSPKVTWNGKTLKAGTDFTVNYGDWNRTETGEKTVTLEGKGNFTGSKEVTVYVSSSAQTSVSKLKITPSKFAYIEGMTQDTVLSKITVKDGKTSLTRDTDFEISEIKDCDHAGTCTFVLTGKGDKYYGKRTISVTITGKSLSKVKASGKAVYNGEEQTLENNEIVLMNGKVQLEEGKDYSIVPDSYKNNINAGKASVTIQGMNAYSGKKTVTFTISPDTSDRTATVFDAVYEKGGVKPKVTVEGLTEGTDFKVTYKNNTKVANADAKKAPTATVTFLGNYKGTQPKSVKFNITQKDISTVDILAADPVYAKKKGNYKAKITLYDSNGKMLTAGTDYDKKILYIGADGKTISASAVLPEGSVIWAVIYGKGNYSGAIAVSYKIIGKPQDISKATFKITPQEYTGYEIELDEADITSSYLKISKKETKDLVYGQDYEVYRYVNNVKNGTAKVIFKGINGYGGTKTVSFKINKKNVPNHWFEQFIGLFGFRLAAD